MRSFCKLFLSVALGLLTGVGALAQYQSIPKEELFLISDMTPSASEKAIIRKLLADNHPNSPEGYYSAAWIQYEKGNNNGSISISNEGMGKYPDSDILHFYVGVDAKDAAQQNHYKRVIEINPDNKAGYRNLYFSYINNGKRAEGGSFLNSTKASIPEKLAYLPDFIHGLDVELNESDFQKAEQLYLSSIQKMTVENPDFEVFQRLLDMRLKKMFNASQMSTQQKFDMLAPITNYLKGFSDNYSLEAGIFLNKAYVYVGKFCMDYNLFSYAYDFFSRGFLSYPTPEIMSDMLTASRKFQQQDYPAQDAYLLIEEYASTNLRDNYFFHQVLGENLELDTSVPEAEVMAHYEKAIALSPFAEKTLPILSSYTIFLEKVNKPEIAIGHAQKLVPDYYDKAPIYDFYAPYFLNGQFDVALDNLQKVEKIRQDRKNINQNYYDERIEALTALSSTQKKISDFYRDNSFNGYWEEKYGQGYSVNVNFPLNSDAIPPSDFGKLDQLANVLKNSGASEYSFKIEGHTDNTGTDAINIPLSEKRAKSVSKYLYTKHQVPYYRMEISGHGATQPIADNSTESGRAKNRRVDAELSANINKPEISTTTTLDTDYLAFSKDGSYFATGYTPMQLWDAQKKVKLRDYEGEFSKRLFSPDGRYIAALQEYNKSYVLAIIDNNIGQIVQQVPITVAGEGLSFSWSPYSDAVVVVNSGFRTRLMVYDVLKKDIRTNKMLTNVSMKKQVNWSPSGRHIAVIERYDKGKVQIFDAATLTLEKEFSDVNWPHALGFNHDGTSLLVSDNGRVLHTWDTGTWSKRTTNNIVFPSSIKSHPSKNIVAMDDWGGNTNNKVAIYDLDKNQFVAQKSGGSTEYKIDFIGDAIARHHQDVESIEIYDMGLQGKLDEIKGSSEIGKGIYKDATNSYIISYDKEGIHIWDLLTGRKLYMWKDNLYSLVQSPNKTTLFYAIKHDENNSMSTLSIYDTSSFESKELLEVPYKITHWGIQGNTFLFAGTPFTEPNNGSLDGTICTYDLNSLSKINQIQVYLPTSDMKFNTLGGSGFTSVALSPDNKRAMVLTYWVDGWKMGTTYSDRLREFDLVTGKETKNVYKNHKMEHIEYVDNDKYRINNSCYNLAGDKFIRSETTDKGQTIGTHQTSKEVAFQDKNILLIYDQMLNKIHYASLKNHENKALTIAVKKNNEWLAYSGSGEFASSVNGTERSFWLLGNKMVAFEAFKDKFERPNLLKQKIVALMGNNISVIDEEDPKIDPVVFEIPYEVEVLSQQGTQIEETYELKLKVTKLDDNAPDPEFSYELNGRDISGARGFEVVPEKETQEETIYSKKFLLTEGPNEIKAYINHNDNRILKSEIKVVLKSNKPVQNITANSHLWFFGVGVKEYEKPDQNLEYADRDIEEVAGYFQKQEGVLYKKVHIKTLVNNDATEKNVRVEMNEFLNKASAEDVIILYVAGHGVQDNEQNLYFMTHDADLKKPYTGMDINKFKTFLRSRPINQKALFWMDICHAGTVSSVNRRGAASSDEAIKALTDGSGTIVFASSTGKQSSLESNEWGGGHGAFSYAILLGLQGSADTDAGNSDGLTSVLELQSYVSRKVPEITDGQQHPTTPESFNVKDFPIGKY